ncbi:hypothetical protein LTR09_011566 [Extremus antarcticus]|uniref:Uncharacterized protein n=1 Tax=Extremus antarcticus TaxID=702011 RepID=A0AAJ0D613_9PEZI|nr:hypothetical protein LTR09_011566 [Extremus antarcticus]
MSGIAIYGVNQLAGLAQNRQRNNGYAASSSSPQRRSGSSRHVHYYGGAEASYRYPQPDSFQSQGFPSDSGYSDQAIRGPPQQNPFPRSFNAPPLPYRRFPDLAALYDRNANQYGSKAGVALKA